jgi:hypothetical protein
LFLAKMQYQATWILLFVSVSFAVAVLAKTSFSAQGGVPAAEDGGKSLRSSERQYNPRS